MNVGELRALIEFVTDDTPIYTVEGEESAYMVQASKATLEFLNNHSWVTQIADDSEDVTKPIGLVLW